MSDCTGVASASRCATTVIEEILGSLPPTARILDAGCGQGVPMLHRTNRSSTGIGLDIARAQLHRARANVPIAPLVHGDMRRLPFQENTFDVTIASHSLAHVPDRHHRSVVAEFARVLRTNGQLLCLMYSAEWGDASRLETHPTGTIDATRTRLVAAGFTIRDEGPIRPKLGTDTTASVHFLRADATE